MIRVGITGPIGSGKSTVAAEWEKLGAHLFYADHQAKRLMVTNAELIQKLKDQFGEQTYFPDGKLNREHLIEEAFRKGRVEELNALVHPVVEEEFRRFCAEAESKHADVVVKEAALLLNRGRPRDLDLIVLLLSKKKSRLTRVEQRDGISVTDAESRDRVQPDFEELVSLADIVLRNDRSLKELREEAVLLYKKLVQRKK